MNINAAAATKQDDLHDRCGKLSLKANMPGEAEFLAKLFRVMTFGGDIVIRRPNMEAQTITFRDDQPYPEPAKGQ